MRVLLLIACLATPALSSAAVDDYLLAVTHDLPPVAREALPRIDSKPRQLLAVRGYSLYANTAARSLDLQLQRWNSNASVGVIAERLREAAVRELSAKSYPATPDARTTLRFANFLREWRPVPSVAPLAVPGLSLRGRSRAIDFQITQNGRIIAPTEVAKVRSVWEWQGWAGKLAAAMRDSRFVGPLQAPNEPWHYEYTSSARAVGAKE